MCPEGLPPALTHSLTHMHTHMHVHPPARRRRGLNEHSNFERFWTAALTLFKIATNDNWTDVMTACLVKVCGRCGGCLWPRAARAALPPMPPTRAAWLPAPARAQPPNCDPAAGECGSWVAYPFFVSFVVLVSIIMLQLFTAVIIESFEAQEEQDVRRSAAVLP